MINQSQILDVKDANRKYWALKKKNEKKSKTKVELKQTKAKMSKKQKLIRD